MIVGAAGAFLARQHDAIAERIDERTLPLLVAAHHLSANVNALTNYAMQFQNVSTQAERATLQERIDGANASIDRNLKVLREHLGEDAPSLRRLATTRADLAGSIAGLAAVSETVSRNAENLRVSVLRLRSDGPSDSGHALLRELAALSASASSPLLLRSLAQQFEEIAQKATSEEAARLKTLMMGEKGVVASRAAWLGAQQQLRFVVRRQADLADQAAAAASALAADAEHALDDARRLAAVSAERLRWTLAAGGLSAVAIGFLGVGRLRRRVVSRVSALNALTDGYAQGGADALDELDVLKNSVGAMQAALIRQKEELTRLSQTDSLTGLPDRRRFYEKAADALIQLRASGGDAALMLLDPDNFAAVNKLLGAAAGDRALQALAALLRRRCREPQMAARLSGDDFAVLLPGTSLNDAEIFAMRLRQSAADPPRDDAESAPALTISVGLTMLRASDQSPDDALSRADAALRRAKQDGGNRVATNAAPSALGASPLSQDARRTGE